MAPPSIGDLKKALIAEGFEVYRTLDDRIVLAERVRDNLIMDSGVAAVTGDGLAVQLVVRAQANDFPGESPDQLFQRASSISLAKDFDGYRELEQNVVPVNDPGDPTRTLDTWYEVTYRKAVGGIDELFRELRHALTLHKTAKRA